LVELREKESRLNRELSTIDQKAMVRADYIKAVEALKHMDIETTLWEMSEELPQVFRCENRVIEFDTDTVTSDLRLSVDLIVGQM
jgi:hypothetical protein